MRKKLLALFSALSFGIAPLAAHADFTIYNNTNYPATASVATSPCSNAAGERGIIQPHGNVVVPDWAAGLYCTLDCKAQVYMSRNCSGRSAATVIGNTRVGVKKVENHNINGFSVTANGKTIVIQGGPALS